MADQDRPADAAGIEFSQDRAGAVPETTGGLLTRPVPGAVERDHVQPAGQPASELLPVCGRTRLAVQQHDLMPVHINRA